MFATLLMTSSTSFFPGAGARTSLIESSRAVGAKCHGGSPSNDDQGEHSLYDRHTRHTSFPSVCRAHLSRFCHAIIPFDPEPGCRYQRESGPSPLSRVREKHWKPKLQITHIQVSNVLNIELWCRPFPQRRNICNLSTS